MRLLAEEEFSYREVADLIRADAAFSVEVLRLANSPVFGFRHEIKDIPHAIAVLGLNRLRGIVMTLAMKDFLRGVRQSEVLRRSWRHNLATALAAELLAHPLWIDPGLGYTAGLLHDLGLLAMITNHEDEYLALIEDPAVDCPPRLLEHERELLGVDHCEVGRWLVEHWGLPPEFQEAAAEHHRDYGDHSSEIATLAHLACETARMVGFPFCGQLPEWNPENVLLHLPESFRARYESQFEELPVTIATKINSFDCDFLT